MSQEPSSRPQPQYWIKFLDPWRQDFYPVLGWGLAPVQGEHNSSQHPHWIKTDFPSLLWVLRPLAAGTSEVGESGFGSLFQERKSSLNIKCLGGIFLGHPRPRRWDIPDRNFMQVAFFCCFRQGVAGMSWDLGRDVPDLENFMQEYFGLIFRTLLLGWAHCVLFIRVQSELTKFWAELTEFAQKLRLGSPQEIRNKV